MNVRWGKNLYTVHKFGSETSYDEEKPALDLLTQRCVKFYLSKNLFL